MDKVLIAMLSLLAPLKNVFRFLNVLADYEINPNLRVDQLPALLIAPAGEQHRYGPMALTETRDYTIKLRIINASIELNKARLGVNNIFSLTEKVMAQLQSDKQLGRLVEQFRKEPIITDLPMIVQGRQSAVSREITVNYYQFWPYAGPANADSLVLQPI